MGQSLYCIKGGGAHSAVLEKVGRQVFNKTEFVWYTT